MVAAAALDEKGHHAEAPGPVLAPELCDGLAMLMVDGKLRLVDHRPAGAKDAVEDVEVAPGRQRRSGVESLVEAAEADQQLPLEGHVAACAEDAGADRMQRVVEAGIAEFVTVEAAPETATPLEIDLCFGVKPERQDEPGESA